MCQRSRAQWSNNHKKMVDLSKVYDSFDVMEVCALWVPSSYYCYHMVGNTSHIFNMKITFKKLYYLKGTVNMRSHAKFEGSTLNSFRFIAILRCSYLARYWPKMAFLKILNFYNFTEIHSGVVAAWNLIYIIFRPSSLIYSIF